MPSRNCLPSEESRRKFNEFLQQRHRLDPSRDASHCSQPSGSVHGAQGVSYPVGQSVPHGGNAGAAQSGSQLQTPVDRRSRNSEAHAFLPDNIAPANPSVSAQHGIDIGAQQQSLSSSALQNFAFAHLRVPAQPPQDPPIAPEQAPPPDGTTTAAASQQTVPQLGARNDGVQQAAPAIGLARDRDQNPERTDYKGKLKFTQEFG